MRDGRGGTSRILGTAVATALVLVATRTPSVAAGGTSVDAHELVAQLTARTASVASYSADISLHVALHSFPFLRLSVGGSTSYQQPGQYAVSLRTLPAIAHALHDVSGDAGDPNVWAHRFDIATDPTAQVPAGLVALRMTQKIHGRIDHIEAYVDTATLTVCRMEWYYDDGGHIFVDDHYAMVGSVLMVDHQDAEIEMPGVRASASSDISNYVIQSVVVASNASATAR